MNHPVIIQKIPMLNPINKISHVQRRQLILTILNSTATKRETKNYFYKYQPQTVKDEDEETVKNHWGSPLRISLIKIRNLERIPFETLKGIGMTIYKMTRLGVSPVVVIDNNNCNQSLSFKLIETKLQKQYEILQNILENASDNFHGSYYSRKTLKDNDFSKNLLPNNNKYKIYTVPIKSMFEVDSDNGIRLSFPQSLLDYYDRRNKSTITTIPIVFPTGYYLKNSTQINLPSDLIMENLALNLFHYSKNTVKDYYTNNVVKPYLLTIEKIIYIDPFGGIPSLERMTSSHVLINLKQESEAIYNELQKMFLNPLERKIHLDNFISMKQILDKLPDQAAAIITSPSMAAIDDLPLFNVDANEENDGRNEENDKVRIEDTYEDDYKYQANDLINQHGELVNSVKIKNPIIYNILTDRPLISPSLPVYLKNTPLLSTTILRKGIDVKYFKSENGLDLIKMHKDGLINLDKFKELIDDSFKRPLNLQNYLERVDKNVAGLVIAGDYEAGAIITWEKVQDKKFAYLDKFAVKRSVQGTFSAADIVFKMMVNELFPNELIWRSRMNNPVNKWYHERSNGSVRVPNTNWRCFWVGKEATKDLNAYLSICDRIQPSWEKN